MEGTSISYFPTAKTALKSISDCILELFKMRVGILQWGGLPSLGATLGKEQQEILFLKSNVVFRLEILFKGTVQGGQNPLPTTHLPPSPIEENRHPYDFPTFETALSTVNKCKLELQEMQQLILQREESQDKVLRIKSSVVSQLEILFKVDDDDADDDEEEGLVQGKESIGQQKMEGFMSSSLHGMKDTKGRFLCLSNGYVIWCLDLKQSSSNTAPRALPIISTLNLLGGKLASSVGLFNLGSDAYIIGGKKLPASLKKRDLRNMKCVTRWGDDPKGMNLYRALCFTQGVKGSSCVTYRLSLDAEKDSATFSLSKGDIEKLNTPKFWPIVENIDGKLHVIDSYPFHLLCDVYCNDFIFSHEVCEVGNSSSGWKDISTGGAIERIFNHLVVGDRIYAVSLEGRDEEYILEFDSQTGEWKRSSTNIWVNLVLPFEVKMVRDILSLGMGRCVGELSFPHPGEGGGERVFVVFAIVWGTDVDNYSVATLTVAYLVTLKGRVICYQNVPDFFSKDKLLQPLDMSPGTIIHVDKDEDDEEEGTTMCSVFCAAINEDGREWEHIFINTFSVQMLNTDAVASVVRQKASEVEGGPPVELEFVHVAVKDSFISKTDLRMRDGGYGRFLGWRACFVTPSCSM